jgi:hypothetical protein
VLSAPLSVVRLSRQFVLIGVCCPSLYPLLHTFLHTFLSLFQAYPISTLSCLHFVSLSLFSLTNPPPLFSFTHFSFLSLVYHWSPIHHPFLPFFDIENLPTDEVLRNHTASEQLGETPTTRAVKDQLKKLSTAPSSSTTTTTAKKSATGAGTGTNTGASVKKARATAAKGKGSAKGKGKGKGKKRAADDDDDDNDDVEDGNKEGDEDEDEETMPAKKKQKIVAVKKEIEDEDEDGEV